MNYGEPIQNQPYIPKKGNEKKLIVCICIGYIFGILHNSAYAGDKTKYQFGFTLQRFVPAGIGTVFLFPSGSAQTGGVRKTRPIAKVQNRETLRPSAEKIRIAADRTTGTGTNVPGGSDTQIIPFHKSGVQYKTDRLQYAWQISGNKDFLATLLAENGSMSEDTKSKVKYWCAATKKWEYDYGVCQVSNCYHPKIVQDEKFDDWRWQMDKCWELFKGGTTFYGRKNISKTSKLIIWKNEI